MTRFASLFILLSWAGACAGEESELAGGDRGSPDGGDRDDAGESRYVIATAISDDESATTYVAVLDSLEHDELDLSRAREFGGWSDMAVIGDYVFVSSGEMPEIERFTVSGDLELEDAGRISFRDYTGDANFYNHEPVSPTKAYMLGEGSELVIWNPSALEITGTLPLPDALRAREGIEPYLALDRGAVVRGDRMFAVVSWTDSQNLNMLADSRILVIDTEADEILDVLEVPCPDLNVADSDDEGNLYFSNWVYSPGATLLYGDAPACAVRILAGSEQLDDWRFDYAESTDHEGAVMSYAGEGRWLYSSFLGDPDAYDPESGEWFDWLFGDTWQLEVLDEDGDSTEVTGIPKNGGGYYTARFEGTTHLLMPGDSYTTTTLYALDADGTATRRLFTEGWSTRLYKLR